MLKISKSQTFGSLYAADRGGDTGGRCFGKHTRMHYRENVRFDSHAALHDKLRKDENHGKRKILRITDRKSRQ